MKRRILFCLCICTILIFSLTGCNKNQSNINDKLDSEIGYIEDLIFKITNKDVKGEYLEDDIFNWSYIKDDIQRINDTWNILVLDLTEVNAPNENMLAFSNDLNELLIAISEENENEMLTKLNDMFSELINFKQSYSQDQNQIEKKKIKNDILRIYNLANSNDYEIAKTNINSLIENYKNLMNNASYAEENSYDLNKVYVLLEEYKNAIETENLNLIKIKYINVIEEI